jgi:hypothetical protein
MIPGAVVICRSALNRAIGEMRLMAYLSDVDPADAQALTAYIAAVDAVQQAAYALRLALEAERENLGIDR